MAYKTRLDVQKEKEKQEQEEQKLFEKCMAMTIIILGLTIVIGIYAFIISGNARYQCYESKMHDGFVEKTGWELLEMQFSNQFDYEEIQMIK